MNTRVRFCPEGGVMQFVREYKFERPLKPSLVSGLNILIVEDDERQFAWARRSLTGHNLTLLRTGEEFSNYQGQPDLIITDLVLPWRSGGQPTYACGMRMFEEAIRHLMAGKIKGLAMVSDFEHHFADDKTREEFRENLLEQLGFLGYFGKEIWWKDYNNSETLIKSLSPHPWNFTIVFDKPWTTYPIFLDSSGKEISYSTLPLECGSSYVRSQGLMLPKPYREVVEVLLMDQ